MQNGGHGLDVLANDGFTVLEETDITQGICDSLDNDHQRKKELITKLSGIDLTSLENAQKDLKREQDNIDDINLKLKSFEDETLELTNSLPSIIRQMEMNLKDVTAISYIVSVDPR